MRWFEIGAALDDFPVGDSPEHYPAKFQPLSALCVRGSPVVPHHDFVVFRNHVLNLNMQIGKALQRPAHILDGACGSRRHSGRHIRTVVHKVGGEVHISNLHVLPVDELFEVVSDKFPGFGMRHSGFGVDGLHGVFSSGLRRLTAELARKFSEELIHGDRRPSKQALQHLVHCSAFAAGVVLL